MKPLVAKIKPASGFSHFFHIGLLVFLPIAVFVFVRIEIFQLALAIILLSKWRMFAMRPRFWPAIVRANSVDIMVGVSMLLFMMATSSMNWQLAWAVVYAVWLIFIKPADSMVMVSAQAFIAQLCGLMALFLAWPDGPLYGLVAAAGLICYISARHFFDSFDEPYTKMLAYLWGYFGAALVWVLGHWLLSYNLVAQPTLILSTLGYGLAVLYYFDHQGRLGTVLRRQFIFIMTAIIIVVLAFSDWGDKVV